jgi:N-methylhydantoinase B/oxoprolinase/acetone carboxylase alpha subunit
MARLVVRDGASGRVKKVLPSKVSHPLRAGETLTCAVPGGGGYGDPWERDPQSVLLDYLDRYISLREARTVFGVVINRGKRQVNLEATRRLRGGPAPG